MRLEKLTNKNFEKIERKKIYCFEKSEAYLEELTLQFPIIDKIAGVIDDNRRNQGSLLIRGRKILVESTAKINQINWKESILLITSDYYKEAYDKICSLPNICNCLDRVFFFANHETEWELTYREQYQYNQLKNMIIFRSGPHASSYVKGMDYADNARALFEYALSIGLNRTYELIWFVKNPEEFKRFDAIDNVKFLSFDWSVSESVEERDAYYRALCLAKYIFFTDAYGFARNCRKDQIRVQLWHGCGFKTRVNFVRCEKRYEYTTVISELYADIHADIYGLRKNQVLVTGYAKQDWLFHPNQEDGDKLHIPRADKYIFWLPTFRSTESKLGQLNEYELASETGLPIINTREKLEQVDELLRQENIVLLIKLHPFQDRASVHCEKCTNMILIENEDLTEKDIPINRLLGMADALISDYSSAAVDYMVLDRPIAFMLEDVEEYEKSRGFVFENIGDWLPGKKIFSFEEVCEFIREIAEGQDTTQQIRRELIKKMHGFADDNNCRRILETLGIISMSRDI